MAKLQVVIFILVATIVLLSIQYTSAQNCDFKTCGSRFGFCQIDDKCKCSYPPSEACAASCTKCLGKLYDQCCSCLEGLC